MLVSRPWFLRMGMGHSQHTTEDNNKICEVVLDEEVGLPTTAWLLLGSARERGSQFV